MPGDLARHTVEGIAGSVVDAAKATLGAYQRPTDQSIAQAIISDGVAAFNVLGVKGLARFPSARGILAGQIKELGVKSVTPGQVVKSISGSQEHPVLGPLIAQMEKMPQHPDDIVAMIEQIRTGPPAEVLTRLNQGLTGVEKMIVPARMRLAAMYKFRSEEVGAVKPFDVNATLFTDGEKAVDAKARQQAQHAYNSILGTADSYTEPWSDLQATGEQTLEHAKVMIAAGTHYTDHLEIMDQTDKVLKPLGVSLRNGEQMARIESALEDGSKFAGLNGGEQLAARYLRNIEDMKIELRHRYHLQEGLTAGAVSRMARKLPIAGIEAANDPTRTWVDGMRGQQMDWAQLHDAASTDTGELEQAKYPTRDAYAKALGPGSELLPYGEAYQADWYRLLTQLELGRVRQALVDYTAIPSGVLKARTGEVGLAEAAQRADFWQSLGYSPENTPLTVSEEVFSPSRVEQESRDLGYIRIIGGTGRRDSMVYQPAIYAKKAEGEAFIRDLHQVTDRQQFQNAIGKFLQKGTGITKGVIMYGAPIHSGNMLRRLLTELMTAPQIAVPTMLKILHAKFTDPAAYSKAKARYRSHGGVMAYRHNLAMRQHWAEHDGQDHGPGAKIAHLGRAVWAGSQEHMVWRVTDDIGLLASLTAEARLEASLPAMSAEVRSMMAARYGSEVAGQNNPLYMSQGWRKWRSLSLFAPSWWASKMRTMLGTGMSMVPTKMGNLLMKKYPHLDPTRLKSLDMIQRREFIRMQRDQFLMSMTSAMVALDGLNQLFSGHHVWDNPEGRMLDVCFDKYAKAQSAESGKSVCMSMLPWVRQELDILSAMGFGHPWGMLHQPSDSAFQQANAADKVGRMAASALDGVHRLGAGRLSPGVNATLEGLLGKDVYAFLTSGQSRDIDRKEALLNFVPGGYLIKQAMGTQGQDWPQVLGSAVLQSSTGLPSIYETGGERPQGVSQDQYNAYQQQSQRHRQQRAQNSQDLMSGRDDIGRWEQKHFDLLNQIYEDQAITFGNSSPSGVLSKERKAIWDKYHLNDAQPDELRTARLDAFNTEWEHTMEHAPEAVKADYWRKEKAQFTDADWLYWYSQQVDHAIMSVIDGHNGDLIRMQKARRAVATEAGFSQADVDALTQSMPELWLYYSYMKQLGSLSPLGALVSAFHSPFSHGLIVQTPEEAAQAQAQGAQGPIFTPSTISALEQQAKAAGQSPQAEQEAGQLGQSPQFQQEMAAGVK
jgi:hypothetical protein